MTEFKHGVARAQALKCKVDLLNDQRFAYAKQNNLPLPPKINVMQFAMNYAMERYTVRMSRLWQVFDKMHLNGRITGGNMWNWDTRFNETLRPTSDIDLKIGRAVHHNIVLQVLKAAAELEDPESGLTFIMGEPTELDHKKNPMSGIRIPFRAAFNAGTDLSVDRALNVHFHIDVGFSAAPALGIFEQEIPVIFSSKKEQMSTGVIKRQPWAYQIAEKLCVMEEERLANSRLKDYRDLWMMANFIDSEDHLKDPNFGDIQKAIVDTFEQRKMPIPADEMIGLSDRFSDRCQDLWAKRRKEHGWTTVPDQLSDVIERINEVLLPHVHAAQIKQRKLSKVVAEERAQMVAEEEEAMQNVRRFG